MWNNALFSAAALAVLFANAPSVAEAKECNIIGWRSVDGNPVEWPKPRGPGSYTPSGWTWNWNETDSHHIPTTVDLCSHKYNTIQDKPYHDFQWASSCSHAEGFASCWGLYNGQAVDNHKVGSLADWDVGVSPNKDQGITLCRLKWEC